MDPQSPATHETVDLSATPDSLGTWRRETVAAGRGRKVRRALGVSVAAAAALGALMFALFQPFGNPDVHLVLIPTEHAEPGDAPLYASADAAAVERFGRQLHVYDENHPPVRLAGIQSPRDVSTLRQQLESIAANRASVLVLYWTVRGVAIDGVPYIVWPGTRKDPAGVRLRAEEVLEQLAKHPAKLKLLVLDVRSLRDANDWPTADEFPRLLREAVEKTGSRSLWLLASHSALERSHLDHAGRRSYFNAFVTHGLRGRADLDRNGRITVEEFHRYVSYGVSRTVGAGTGMRTSQTPLLCWGGGGDFPRSSPNLVPVLADVEAPTEAKPAGPLFPDDVALAEVRSSIQSELAAMPKFDGYPAPPVIPDASRLRAQAAKAKPAATKAAASDAKTQATPKAAAKIEPKAKPTAQESPAPGTPIDLAKKFVVTWLWHDAATRRTSAAAPTAADAAPHIVHRLQHRLLQCELAYRTLGPFVQSEKDEQGTPPEVHPAEQSIAAALDELIRLFKALRAGHIELNPTASPLEKLVAEHLKRRNVANLPLHSLGLYEYSHRLSANGNGTSRLAKNFDKLLTDGNRAKLAEFVGGLTGDQRKFAELHLASRLSNASPARWPAIRAALQTRRYAERVVALSTGRLSWVKSILETADRHRLAGERRLLDGIGPDYQAWALRRLREAVGLYGEAVDRLKLVDSANALRNDVFHELPGFTDWARRIDDVSTDGNARLDRLRKTAAALRQLSAELDSGKTPNISSLRRAVARLQTLRKEVADDFQRTIAAPAESTLGGEDPVPGDAERFNAALNVPTLTAPTRLSLYRALREAAQNAPKPSFTVPESPLLPPERTLTDTDAERIRHRAALAVELLRLRQSAILNADQKEAAALRTAAERIEKAAPGDWTAVREFDSALRDARDAADDHLRIEAGGLLAVDATSDDWAKSIARLRRVEPVVRGSAFSRPVNGEDAFDRIVAQRQSAAAMTMLAFQRERLLAAIRDAPRTDSAWLRDTAEKYRAAVPAALLASNPDGVRSDLELTSPAVVSLRESPTARFTLTLASTRNSPYPVVVWTEYDPAVLKLRSVNETSLPVVKHAEGPDSLANRTKSDVPAIKNSAVLQPGEPISLPMEVTRLLKARPQPARVVFHVVCGPNVVRRSIEVRLPSPRAVELIASGPPEVERVASQTATGPRLFPFSNRVTPFRMSLRNLTGRPRTVNVRLLSLTSPLRQALPEAELPGDRANALLRKLSAGAAVVESDAVTLSAGDDAVPIAFKAAAGGSKKPAPKTAQPAPIVLDNGLLAVIEDAKTKKTSLRAVSFAPQRPRRFLQVRVAYDEPRSLVTIRIRPKDANWLPAEPVAVRCSLVGETQPQATLSGLLKRGEDELVLTGTVAGKSDNATLHIDVDDFPRAFIFRFRPDRTLATVPELLTRRSLQIVSPESGKVYGKSDSQIPVTFRVDAPVGSFVDGGDEVEVGIDVNRDRLLKNEPALQFPSDRQTTVTLENVADDGALEIKTAISDFTVTLPTRGLPSRRVDLLGRLQVAGDSSWSNFVPIVFDTSSPGLAPVRLARIVAGQAATFAVQADDSKLSGIQRIELFIDEKRTGKFPMGEGIVAAEATGKGDWLATLKTEEMQPGNYPVLVRAVDTAGNVSETQTTRLVILSKAQAVAAKAAKANRVEGVLTFDKDPVPGAVMTLQPAAPAGKKPPAGAAAPAKIAPVKTDAAGKFAFPKVPPGKYTLTAYKRALANKNRRRSIAIEVAAPPKPAVRVQMMLR